VIEPVLPKPLRDEVARSLAPVRPLGPPLRRAALFLPLGAAIMLLVPLVRGLRGDAAAVGVARLWGGSTLQLVVGVLVLAAAFAESIPGRSSSASRLALRALLALSFVLGLTALTFQVSPTTLPPGFAAAYFRTCTRQPFLLGLLPLAVAASLLRRGLPARPGIAGALAGLGAGLVSDAGWRLFCEVADPAHVLATHAAAILALTAVGGSVATLVERIAPLRP
jgi:hypothetical protein